MAITIDGIEVAGIGAPGLSAYRSAQLGGYTGTEEEFYAALAMGGGGMQMELAWENASIASEFAPQSLMIPHKEGEWIIIEACVGTGPTGDRFYTTAVRSGTKGTMPYSMTSGAGSQSLFRLVDATDSAKISFGEAYSAIGSAAESKNNTWAIPARVYILKGVTTNV